jgi:hypothetical protein
MINKSTLSIEDRLLVEVADLRRELEAMKAKQLFGSDNLVITRTGGVNASVTLAAGAYQIYQLQYTGYVQAGQFAYYLSELGIDIYITNDNDPTYLWPVGGNVVGDLALFDVTYYYSPAKSDELGSGLKTYLVRILNTGVSSKTVYFHAKLLYIAATLS